jgi:small subunit ribosomal protein S27Ae
MHIQIKTLTGRTCSLVMDSTSSIDSLYTQVEQVMGVPREEQKLILNGRRLETGKLLFDYSEEEEANVYLVVDLEGGKGKKKKKDMKKGSKKKHKKRKVKLAILKYYKVEGDKVVRTRQMCKVCPPGTFLAEHSDRLYCGRCHTSYGKLADAKKGAAGAKDAGKGGKKK